MNFILVNETMAELLIISTSLSVIVELFKVYNAANTGWFSKLKAGIFKQNKNIGNIPIGELIKFFQDNLHNLSDTNMKKINDTRDMLAIHTDTNYKTVYNNLYELQHEIITKLQEMNQITNYDDENILTIITPYAIYGIANAIFLKATIENKNFTRNHDTINIINKLLSKNPNIKYTKYLIELYVNDKTYGKAIKCCETILSNTINNKDIVETENILREIIELRLKKLCITNWEEPLNTQNDSIYTSTKNNEIKFIISSTNPNNRPNATRYNVISSDRIFHKKNYNNSISFGIKFIDITSIIPDIKLHIGLSINKTQNPVLRIQDQGNKVTWNTVEGYAFNNTKSSLVKMNAYNQIDIYYFKDFYVIRENGNIAFSNNIDHINGNISFAIEAHNYDTTGTIIIENLTYA